ncbi:MAG: hypothetical protein GWP91_14205 [Rhodobacterales bacterium]|nr:hypothetical protein [Rhodobacterales bacterium]
MITLLLTAASLAQSPAAQPVQGIEWARAFTLDEATVFPMRADHPAVQSGWMVAIQLSADPTSMRQIEQPVLYIGEWPVRVLKRTPEGCVMGWVPSETLLNEPVYLGPNTLPERVTPAEAAASKAVAFAGSWRADAEALKRIIEANPLFGTHEEMLQSTARAACARD